MTTTYTVLNHHGTEQVGGVGLAEAAQTVLGYDGHEYDIRRSDTGWELWTSSFSRASAAYNGLTRSTIYSLEDDRDAAERDIWTKVIHHADWFCGCTVMTDAEYDAMQAEIARDAE